MQCKRAEGNLVDLRALAEQHRVQAAELKAEAARKAEEARKAEANREKANLMWKGPGVAPVPMLVVDDGTGTITIDDSEAMATLKTDFSDQLDLVLSEDDEDDTKKNEDDTKDDSDKKGVSKAGRR